MKTTITPAATAESRGTGCSGGPAEQAQLGFPPMWTVLSSLNPTLEWIWQEADCIPEHFVVHLKTGPNFSDQLGATIQGGEGQFTWSPDVALEPGREYAWGIQAVGNSITGPYAGEHYFFTGPSCVAGSLAAPSLLFPMNDWTVDDLGAFELKWWYDAGCLPDGYEVKLNNTLIFDGSPYNFTTTGPSMRGIPPQVLTDCTRYYWMVRAVKDGQAGPWSPEYTFRVQISGGCPTEGPNGMIRGTVWEDQCAGIGPGTPVAEPIPYGCVLNADDQLFTNQTYDPGEPGIHDLVVSLGHGACPSSDIQREVSTAPDGMFNFYILSPGTYCVSVDIKHPYNVNILVQGSGSWTFPLDVAPNAAIASQTVVVENGQDVSNVNFGWWYKYGNAWGSPNATVFGTVWHDLCAYTPGDPVPDPLPAGCAVNQYGIVEGNGIRETGEVGIEQLVVDLGPGPCPSAGTATAVTNVNGEYYFTDIPPGDYCLRIDPNHGSPNADILLPGHWTVVPSGHEGMTFRAITLLPATTLPGQDFGWDFDNAPAVEPTFTLTANAYCRYGPDIRYHAITSFLAGDAFPIEGKSLDGLWLYVKQEQVGHCWFASSQGNAAGDLGSLHIFTGPPLPTDTPPFSCSLFTDEVSCTSHPTCEWYNPPGTTGRYYCKEK